MTAVSLAHPLLGTVTRLIFFDFFRHLGISPCIHIWRFLFNRRVILGFRITVRSLVDILPPGDPRSEPTCPCWNENAQSHGGRQETLPCRIPVRRIRVIRATHIAPACDFLIRCFITLILDRSRDRHKKARQIPARRRFRQQLPGKGMIITGTDEIQAQCLNKFRANVYAVHGVSNFICSEYHNVHLI